MTPNKQRTTARRLKRELGALEAFRRFASVQQSLAIQAEIMAKRHQLSTLSIPRKKRLEPVNWKKRALQLLGFLAWAIAQSFYMDFIYRSAHR